MSVNPIECGTANRSDAVREYSRILTAAVISSQFRQMLLSNPAKAIAAGFGGEAFCLENEEKNRVASIRATTLADFASELNRMRQPLPGAMHALAGD
jgi:hypothetical protein